MSKNLKKFLLFVLMVSALVSIYCVLKKISEKKFLSQMKGEVVFAKRDNGILNIYKINANGTGLKMLYHNEDKNNSNSASPYWSQDGKRVYFRAMQDGVWKIFEMDATEQQITNILEKRLSDRQPSRADIIINRGSVYWQDEQGKNSKVYPFYGYDGKLNTGASEASWSPDKKYIIFESCALLKGCRIIIVDKNGKKATLTKGQYPDWKY